MRALKFLCCIVLLFATRNCFGDTETINGITWRYTVSNGEVSLGGGSYSSTAVPPSTSGAITIPSSIKGLPVTSIGNYAFYNCNKMTGVMIPNSVTVIGSFAFSGCSRLTGVTIPNSVTNIGNSAFSNCSGLTSVTIPNSVTSIEGYTFESCLGLKSVTIPDGVTSIGTDAFSGCNNQLFDTTTIPGVKLVDGWAVDFTSQLSGYIDLTSIRGIGHYAFSGCSGLTSVTLPVRVTSIADWSFSSCSRLTSVMIPNGVTSIGSSSFSSCSSLTSVTIPNSVTNIGFSAFNNCSGLISIWIPDSVKSIGNYAFYGCSGLTGVTIPNSVTSIGTSAFEGCSSLTSMMIPNSITSIGWYVFKGCNGLTSVTIPSSVTCIGNSAFSGCSGLTSVVIPNSVTEIEMSAFEGCRGLTNVTISTGLTSIGGSVFKSCSSLTSVIIPDGVTSVSAYAFEGNHVLNEVTIPESVTSIGEGAFCECHNLATVAFKGDRDAIGMEIWSVFECTPWLQAQPFGFEVQNLKDGEVWLVGYYGSPVPTDEITVPDDVTMIRGGVLPTWNTRWDGEEYVRFLGWFTEPTGGEQIRGKKNSPIAGGTMLYAQWETVQPEWEFYIEDGGAVIAGNSVDLVGDVVIPSSVVVEEEVEGGNMAEVAYPVTGISGRGSVYGGISSVVIPASVTSISDWSFADCSFLTNVVFEGAMGAISMNVYRAFSDTPWLRSKFPPPDNDDFADAVAINGMAGRVMGTNLGASVEDGEPLPLEEEDEWTFDSTATVWWKWTAPTNGHVVFKTLGSDFDTVLGVYTGSTVDALEKVAVNDECFGDGTSAVDFDVVMGTTYCIAVGGYDRYIGNVVLSWGMGDVVVETEDGKMVMVSGTWLDGYDTLLAAHYGDKAACANSTAANGRKVWECYALGLNPEDNSTTNDFKITSFPMKADGTPDLENIVFEPPEARWNVEGARPVVKGTESLGGEWQTVTEENKAEFRFFKVEVVLP